MPCVCCCFAVQQGFQLQDPEVDDVVRAARDLEAGCIEPDTSLSAEENVELLLRATRLLQLGLEVQFTEAEGLLSENNGLRDDLRVSGKQDEQQQLKPGCPGTPRLLPAFNSRT